MSKLALITGASSGIGLELAKVMAMKGHDLILVARSKAPMDELASALVKQFGIKVIVHPFDLAQRYSGEALYESLRKYNDDIEYIVNNAGFGEVKSFHLQNLTVLDEMLQLNITSLTEICRVYSALFATHRRGKILNVASTGAFQPGPYMSAYYASKSYVLSLSEAIREELREYNVQVCALCPGPTHSGFQARAGMSEARFRKMAQWFSSLIMTSADVASIGYVEWMKNKSVIIPGPFNKMTAFFGPIAPRWLTTRIVSQINKA